MRCGLGFVAPRRGALLLLAAVAAACTHPDPVFEVVEIELPVRTLDVREDAGVVNVTVSLASEPRHTVRAHYRALELEAQSGCQLPDFRVASGFVQWEPGRREATIELWIDNDELAETDERFVLLLERDEAALGAKPVALVVRILDDDRTALIEGGAHGLLPNSGASADGSLQAALDAAAASGRGVVVLSPGDYELTSVQVPAGVTLSGRGGVRLLRPPMAPAETRSLRLEHAGADDSRATLIEGLTIDGRRDEQGDFRGYEKEHAALIEALGDAAGAGRLRAVVEDVALSSGTGDGIAFGVNVDATLCRVRGNDLWREVVGVRGGNTSLRVRELDASATAGTSGLWVIAEATGHADSRRIDVEMEDVRLETGDVEIDVAGGSSVVIRGLFMTEPPFRLVASDSVVRISDSVLSVGIDGDIHDYWGPFADVQLSGTTLRISELDSQQRGLTVEPPEADRTLSIVAIRPQDAAATPAPGQLRFEHCRFELASNVEALDSVFAVRNPDSTHAVVVRDSVLGPGLEAWFAPECAGCVVEP